MKVAEEDCQISSLLPQVKASFALGVLKQLSNLDVPKPKKFHLWQLWLGAFKIATIEECWNPYDARLYYSLSMVDGRESIDKWSYGEVEQALKDLIGEEPFRQVVARKQRRI